MRNNRVREFLGARRSADIARVNFAFFENFQHGGFDLVCCFAFVDAPTDQLLLLSLINQNA